MDKSIDGQKEDPIETIEVSINIELNPKRRQRVRRERRKRKRVDNFDIISDKNKSKEVIESYRKIIEDMKKSEDSSNPLELSIEEEKKIKLSLTQIKPKQILK